LPSEWQAVFRACFIQQSAIFIGGFVVLFAFRQQIGAGFPFGKTYCRGIRGCRQLPQFAFGLAGFPTQRYGEIQITKYCQGFRRLTRDLVSPTQRQF